MDYNQMLEVLIQAMRAEESNLDISKVEWDPPASMCAEATLILVGRKSILGLVRCSHEPAAWHAFFTRSWDHMDSDPRDHFGGLAIRTGGIVTFDPDMADADSFRMVVRMLNAREGRE